MLPSKGYFSGMPCPFYDSSICERPHCHFRHSKKDKTNTKAEEVPKSKKDDNVSIIKELVTKTVKHVLSHTEIREKTENTHLNTDAIVTDVVKTFQPAIESKIEPKKDYANLGEVPSYKPTPISELNKKHIPVAYAPTRPIYLDKFRKKEVKDFYYTPKSLSENSFPTTTYIPSSSKARCEAYTPESVGSYRYFTSQISGGLADTNDKLNIPSEENNASNVNKSYEPNIDNQGMLDALDKLIEDEFDIKPKQDISDVKLGLENNLNAIVKDVDITRDSHVIHPKEAINEDIVEKNKSEGSSKHSHSRSKGHSNTSSSKSSSSHEKHSHSKSKSRSSDVLLKSNVSDIKKHASTKSSNSDEKHTHSKTSRSSDSSSKHSSGHSKSKSRSGDSSAKHSSSREKHSSSHEKPGQSSSKIHSSKDSTSKTNSSTEKCKLKSSSKKCVKDKNKSSRNKEKSKSSSSTSSKQIKTPTKIASIENKLLKKKEKSKEDHKKSHKKKEKSPVKEKPIKYTPSKKTYNEPPVMETDAFFKLDSVSSTSDLEEVFCSQEPILIDSSSSCSSTFEQVEEFSQGSESSKINSDDNSEMVHNMLSSPSGSEYADDSPPPTKRFKEDEEGVKITSNFPASTVFSDRWKKARETVKKPSGAGKIRIAHVPNVSSLLNAKDKLIAKTKPSTKVDPSLTLAKKTEDLSNDSNTSNRIRKAHAPSQQRIKYPSPIMEENLKVPTSIRQSCLNNLYDEFLKYCGEEESRTKAQTEELEICRRLHVPKTYRNTVALTLLKIRKMKGKSEGELESLSNNRLTSATVPEYTYGWSIYKCFTEYLMQEEEFVSHGFPVEIKSKPGCAFIEKTARRYDVKQPDDPNLRICANCSNKYYVDDKGFPVKEFDCYYHWGRLGRTRVRGGITEFYRCCNGEIGSEPCTTGRYHVCNSYDEDCLEGFVSTRSVDEEPEKAGVYAMDCEMCYTTRGLDLTRCTVVDINGEMVYDEVVVPEYPILDYNTRFSGITEDMVLKSRKKLRHVQRDLLKFVHEKSIFVGHSLENDFKALRLLHRTVVDTSIVFPHHLGLPYKKALKFIAKDILKINIQENEAGHDSYEDANTCMQIMLAKIKEDAKKRKPRVIISLDSSGKTKVSAKQKEIGF